MWSCHLVIFIIVSDSPQQNTGQNWQISYSCYKPNTKYELTKLQQLILSVTLLYSMFM